MADSRIAFGPVPSRRLGSSLGINHIPPKHCPYSCVYCQVGRTTTLETTRRDFYPLDRILQEVERKISDSVKLEQPIDYLTLVPDGEPTLDINLGKIIEGLEPFGIPIAVISNASLINRKEIQDALFQADWVSLKVDAVSETDWRRINRPYRRLSISSILTGIHNFRSRYHGELVTETMLVAGINDSDTAIQNLSAYLLELQPFISYLSIPTRPPAESWVKAPDADSLKKILAIISEKVSFVDLLFESEGSDFISTGNIIEDILSISAVHPIREEALRSMVTQAGAEWMIVEDLITSKKITCIQYREAHFYSRSLMDSNTS
jgi:wyosine [tRNA(Phe)-imidazoG37] synthetase (radical SAM superfamily)